MKFFLLCLVVSISLLQANISTLPNSLQTLPIQEGGRRKPYVVFAEETLRFLSGKTALSLHGRREEAGELITSFWLDPQENYAQEPLIFLSSVSLKKTLELPLTQSLFSYETLIHHEGLQKLISEALEARRSNPRQHLEGILKEVSELGMRLSLFEELSDGSLFRIIPSSQASNNRWETLSSWESDSTPAAARAHQAFSLMQEGWKSNNEVLFNEGVIQFRGVLNSINPEEVVPTWRLQLEVLLQKLHPFRLAWMGYALAGIFLFFFRRTLLFNRLGQICAWSGFLIQAFGLLSRMLIAGRPPVTNMYESMIWVAFGTIFFALLFEARYRAGVFLLGAIPVALLSLILADTQPIILDPSIHPLTPVLRDNFWLTIHVLTITLSYAAFALSLGVAHVILTQIILDKKIASLLYQYLYRTLQIGVLLLATGTILGGVWANYSWGRFWDWDPKETWALIALLGYLFLLHGRLAGYWGGFGLAIGSLFAFNSILMAWYGVNFVLGAGLHSYGFGSGGLPCVLAFVGMEVLIAAAALFARFRAKRRRSATRGSSS